MTFPTRPGVKLRFARLAPEGRAVAAVILFRDGDGHLGSWDGGAVTRADSFLVRVRLQLMASGLVVILPDVPSDRRAAGLNGFRLSEAHRKDIAALISLVRKIERLPVWLIGHGGGAVTAASAALLLDPAGREGIVLSSSQTRAPPQGSAVIFDIPLEKIAVPVNVMHHEESRCPRAPFLGAAAIMGRLENANPANSKSFRGGKPRRKQPCSGLSRHGYFGIEKEVVEAMSEWIRRHAAP